MALFSRTRINRITGEIISAAIEIHRRLGPGMFESVYHRCMAWELRHRGLKFITEHQVAVVYKGEHLDAAFEIDLFVEGLVVVELKSVAEIHPVHETQLLTQVRLTDVPVGLLINFNVEVLKEGIRRKINEKHVLVDELNPIDRAKYRDWIEKNKDHE